MPLGDLPRLEVDERSTAVLTREQYRQLEGSDEFLSLLDAGVVSLVRSRAAPHGLRTGPFVGEAILDGRIRLRVMERVPGSVEGLLRAALPQDVRGAEAPAPVAPESPVLGVFLAQFVLWLGEYLRHGPVKEYVRERRALSSPRGRIELRDTARLLARGQASRVVVTRDSLSADIGLNRALGLGLDAVERFAELHPGTELLRTSARLYAPLFADVDLYGLMRAGPASQAVAFEEALSDRRSRGDLRNALAYARALVLSLGAWPEEYQVELPHSFFLNLEALFEEAVRRVFEEVLTPIPVAGGAALGQPLFDTLPDRYLVDPDIVVGEPGPQCLVADCKYRDLDGFPGHAEVYQLVSHCEALGAGKGLLIYPSTVCQVDEVGTTRNGILVLSSTVRPAELAQDVGHVCQAIGLAA
jgi:5-methylcytosine-specific restriction endonuclease McrBC regulatory subunit McrC